MITVRGMKWRFAGTVMAIEEFRIIIRVLIMCSLKNTDRSNVKKEFSPMLTIVIDSIVGETLLLKHFICWIAASEQMIVRHLRRIRMLTVRQQSFFRWPRCSVVMSCFHQEEEEESLSTVRMKNANVFFCSANRRTERNATCLYRRRFQVDYHFSLMLESLSYLRTCNLARWFHLAVLAVWCLKMTRAVLSFLSAVLRHAIYRELFACRDCRGWFVADRDRQIPFGIGHRGIDADLWLNLEKKQKKGQANRSRQGSSNASEEQKGTSSRPCNSSKMGLGFATEIEPRSAGTDDKLS